MVIGEDGPEKCVITGAADPDAAETEYGCGANAVRCISAAASSFAFQRFTFTGGHTVGYAAEGYGGLMRGYGTDGSQILDSVITNCVGNRGAAIFVGALERCLVRDCRDYYGVVRSGTARNCVFESIDVPPRSGFIGQDEYAYGCTFVNRSSTSSAPAFAGANATGWNNIHYRATCAATKVDGNVYYASGAVPAADQHAIQADPKLAYLEGGDYRLQSDSPAIGCGTATNEYWKYAGGDRNGNAPLVVGGRPTPGAFQTLTTARVTVEAPSDGTVTPSGVTVLEPGESVTITLTRGTRNQLGYLVNGETQTVDSVAAGWTVTAPPYVAGVAFSNLNVSVLYSPHWYVNPQGSDANDGWTTDTPFETLAYAMTLATNSGDIVHASAGVYTNGFTRLPLQSNQAASTVNLRVRVSVPDYVSLVSEAGPEKTFIVGEKDPDSKKYDGCGSNAVKCVYLANCSRVSGFTICGGRVTGDLAEDVNSSGGGVFSLNTGKSDYAGIVENCIVSNNYGRSGAATYRGRIVGCQILENHAYSSAPVGRYSNLYNCYVDRNYGSPTYQIYYALENCTFGPSNVRYDGSTDSSLFVCMQPQTDVGGKTAVAKNCVFMDRVQKDGGYVVLATNCVFRNDDASYYPTDETNRLGCALMSVADMKMQAETCVPAADSPLTDAADAALMSDMAKRMDATCESAEGGRRVYNGCADIGAFEHDWRPEYATMLGATSVEAAGPQVVGRLGETALTIRDGSLKLTLSGGSTRWRNRITVPFAVFGGGVFGVATNGTTVGTYVSEGGVGRLLTLFDWNETTVLDFTYDGADEGVVLSRLGKSTPGTVFVIR